MTNFKDVIKTKYDLKYYVSQSGSHFFDRDSMKFFGDTMANYGFRKESIVINSDDAVVCCFELTRKNKVKCGISDSTFFSHDTLERILPKKY